MNLLLLTLLAVTIGGCSCAKILCLMPVVSRSHTKVVEEVCLQLAARKHDVTAVTAFPRSNQLENYKQISIESLFKEFMLTKGDFDIFKMRSIPMAIQPAILYFKMASAFEDFLNHPEVVQLLQSDEKYDLIFSEIFLTEAIVAGFSLKMKAPLVVLSPSIGTLWTDNLVGNPAPFSYIPDPLLGFDTKMSFFERLVNTVYGLAHGFLYHCIFLPTQNSVLKKYFGNDMPPLKDVLRNVSLVLINHHYSLSYPRPNVPNMIEVGGMHVPKVKKLPEDLQKYLDDAKEGVIYFSLGSNIESAKLPKEKLQIFLDVFGKLKQNVLWKWETDDLPGKPNNVKISKWLPQSDILAHPNLKLFVTHGGHGSVVETIHRGVPIVGIPLFAEQPLNIKYAEMQGFARNVDFDVMTVESLHAAITDVLEDPKYRENAQYRSNLMKDTPLSAMDTCIYWIEYVIRHKGAYHLRSAAQDLSWYQLYLLDVLFVIVGTVALIVGTIVTIYKTCKRRYVRRRSNTRNESEEKKKK